MYFLIFFFYVFFLPSDFLRVENSLFGFSSKLLIFCDQKSEIAFALGKEQIQRFALGHKKGKSGEKLSKKYEKYDFLSKSLVFLRATELFASVTLL